MPLASKLQVKVESLVREASSILQPFSTQLWQDLRESKLTGILSKLAIVHAEVNTAGDAQSASLVYRRAQTNI